MDNIIELIKNYMGEYNKKEHPFLLFDLAHVNENDHTRVLMGILEFKDSMFLPSFLQMIGAPAISKIKMPPTDQRRAIGNKGTGFIDLYFEYKSNNVTPEKVIIENKIYDAGDSERQLARYIATAINAEMFPSAFNRIWEKWKNGENDETVDNNEFSHIHVVYLTSDGSKKPEERSLPQYFGKYKDGNLDEVKHINYYPINYIENIIPWLENDVLPNMPYYDDGIAIAGIRQYVASLKAGFCAKGDSDVISGFVDNNMKDKTDKNKYDELMSVMFNIKSLTEKKEDGKSEKGSDEIIKSKFKNEGINVEDLQLKPLVRDLRAAATNIFSKDGSELGGDWKLYFTPSAIFLYRQKWADLDTRKYSIPSIYFVTSTYNFLNAKKGDDNVVKWKLQVDHLNYRNVEKNKKDPFSIGNHNKTAFYETPSFKIEFDVDDLYSRKLYYKNVLGQLEEYISLLDKVVEEVLNGKSDNGIFQEYVLERLAEEIKKITVQNNEMV